MEHFDEKLDDYLRDGIAGDLLSEYVGPLPVPDGVPLHLFRAYYLDAGLFEMLGKRYEIDDWKFVAVVFLSSSASRARSRRLVRSVFISRASFRIRLPAE